MCTCTTFCSCRALHAAAALQLVRAIHACSHHAASSASHVPCSVPPSSQVHHMQQCADRQITQYVMSSDRDNAVIVFFLLFRAFLDSDQGEHQILALVLQGGLRGEATATSTGWLHRLDRLEVTLHSHHCVFVL